MKIIYLIPLFLVTYGQHICSTNGFYDEIQKQCICDLGYFRDDCSSEGIQLIDELILQEDQQYYIYGLASNQTLRIKLDNELYSIYIRYQVISQTYEHGVFQQLQLLQNQENLIDITSGQTNTIFIIYIQKAHGNISYKPQSRLLSDSHNDNHDHSSDNNNQNSSSGNSASLIAGIIAPIVTIILMIIFGLYCYKRIKRRREKQQQLAQKQHQIKPRVSAERIRQNQQIIQQPEAPRLIELQLRKQPIQKTNTSKMSNISGVEECSICLQPLSKSIVSTPCNHKFHTGCIKEFLAYQKNCPLCRTELQDNQLLIVK